MMSMWYNTIIPCSECLTKYKWTNGILDFSFVDQVTKWENIPAFLDTTFSLNSVTCSVFFKYMFQLYQGVGQRSYYQVSHIGCCMWKPTTLTVGDNSGNIAYPEAVSVRIPHRVQEPLLVLL